MAAPASAGPVQGPPPGLERRRLRVGVGQVVCWQLVAGVAAGLVGRGWVAELTAGLLAVGVLALTATWRRGLWSYQWLRLAVAYLVRGTQFVAVEGLRGELETGAGTIIRSDGVTVLLETDVPPELQPADLLDEYDGLRIKLLRRPGRAWIALTALRSADRPRDTELELLLTNAVRRLTKRLRRRGLHAEPLGPDELPGLLATLTPKHLTEEWDALLVGGGRFRMYAVPSQLALQQAGAIAVTTASDLEHALVLAPAGAPAAPGAVPQTGRHRSAFVAALP
ncbi:type VII secretion protein EccE [Kribbella sp. HUAS MG21]|uniref:Type VII secretion protein EccE n=1 Tax=Kribbella sp. HUAS MG21 TaxID=3160966 RepID=A0AAU7THQ9_9ACTN